MLAQFIEHFTYSGLFVTLLGAGFGLPIPEEVPVLASGVLVHQHVLRWWIALPVCLIGVLSGDTALYGLGHHWGERILDRRLVRLLLSRAREKELLERYRRHGVKIVFTARHVMGLRAAAFLTAGIARVGFWKFLAVDFAAALIAVPVSFSLGYLFADQLDQVMRGIHRFEAWLALYALVAMAAYLLVMAYRRPRT